MLKQAASGLKLLLKIRLNPLLDAKLPAGGKLRAGCLSQFSAVLNEPRLDGQTGTKAVERWIVCKVGTDQKRFASNPQ